MAMKDYKPEKIWPIIETETLNHSDYTLFLGSGKRLLQKLAFNCIPSFLQRKLRPNAPHSQRLHPTSYLDGLRGVASFIVFMGHYTEENVGWYTEPYGLYEDGAPSSFLQLPFIRVLYSARPMVHIFFIISGFVLTYKPLKQIHNQKYSALVSTLSSSVFRRAVRLFLPSFITLFIMSLAVHYGISEPRYGFPLYSISAQLTSWYDTCWYLLQTLWAWDDPSVPLPRYNPALWTIPVEFAQSMLLFIVMLGLSHCLVNMRLILLATIIVFCFYSAQLHAVEFLGGMFIAEVTLLQSRSSCLPTSPTTSPILPTSTVDEKSSIPPTVIAFPQKTCATSTKKTLIRIFWNLNLVSGLFISSWTNEHIDEVPGLSYLDTHTPSPYTGQRIWFCFAAFQIVLACTQLPLLQSLFNTPFAQYLGNISYALYLTHNLCLTILEPRVGPLFVQYIGKQTFWGRHVTWLMGLLVYLPVIVCVADGFWRGVDVQTVRFARWLESKCLVGNHGIAVEGHRRRNTHV